MVVELPPHLQTWVEAQVRAGRYQDAATAVRDSLEQFIQARQEHEWVEAELEKGFDDLEAGRVQSFESAQSLKRAVAERVQARR